jgi:hypothetical protein
MGMRSKTSRTDENRGRVLGEARNAYVLLEEARLQCESLEHQLGTSSDLHAAHRDIGLSGYHASSNFASELRERSLAEAHCNCRSVVSIEPRKAIEIVLQEVLTACDGFTYVATHSSDSDVQTAHKYALAAAERLECTLAVPVTAGRI